MKIINEDNPTLVLGGEEHEIEKLNETSKYYIDQVQDLNTQMLQIKAKLHQCEVARAGFVSLLASEIEAQNKVFKDVIAIVVSFVSLWARYICLQFISLIKSDSSSSFSGEYLSSLLRLIPNSGAIKVSELLLYCLINLNGFP